MASHEDAVAEAPPIAPVTRPSVVAHVVVIAGGEAGHGPPPSRYDLVIAADSGADTARALGIVPDVVVGDLDSISNAALEELEGSDAAIVRHDVDKDAGDLELALDLAMTHDPAAITVIGGDRGSLAHLLVNASIVASERYGDATIRWETTDAVVHVVHAGAPAAIGGVVGDLVTLLAVGGNATGVATTGLRWSLDGRTIFAGSSLGLSNEVVASTFTVTLESGTLLAIHERSGIR